jgi:hypothetical protein
VALGALDWTHRTPHWGVERTRSWPSGGDALLERAIANLRSSTAAAITLSGVACQESWGCPVHPSEEEIRRSGISTPGPLNDECQRSFADSQQYLCGSAAKNLNSLHIGYP